MRSGGHENEEMISDEDEEAIVEGSEDVIVGTNPCLVENEQTIDKEPIVYQRRRFRSQGSKLVHHSPNNLFHQSQTSPQISLH
jgi:hypothetical protein